MMGFKLSKGQLSNVIWILAIALIVFTPVGFHLKVWVGKIFATSADVVDVEQQKTLEDYNWLLVDSNGQRFNFESNKGEVILINFWATWCPPCVAEMPSLAKLYADYGDKVVFAFVANDHADKVSSFLQKKDYQLPVFYEADHTPELLEHSSIPTTYVLSRTGKIVIEESGVADWNSQKTRNLLDSLILE